MEPATLRTRSPVSCTTSTGLLSFTVVAQSDTYSADGAAASMPCAAATITATPVVDVDVKTGNAFAPAGIKQGTATVDGAIVTQWVNAATLPGVTYHLRCRATLSDGRVLVISADLPVVKA